MSNAACACDRLSARDSAGPGGGRPMPMPCDAWPLKPPPALITADTVAGIALPLVVLPLLLLLYRDGVEVAAVVGVNKLMAPAVASLPVLALCDDWDAAHGNRTSIANQPNTWCENAAKCMPADTPCR